MPNKEFLEKYPLYKRYNFEPRESWNKFNIEELPRPAINMYCKGCESIQTYNATDESKYEQPYKFINDNIFRLQYICTGCYKDVREFMLQFKEWSVWDEKKKEHIYYLQVQKVGQYPAWSIEMDKELENMIGDHAEYYKRGLICESQSYGIGAYAYFRRVTEDVIDDLLESILDLVEEEEKKEYKEKLEEVRKEKIAEKKINLVKDLLPKSLQVDGMNPLKELYGVLSEGIHDKTDEECMEKAEAIRGILVFLVNQVVRTKRDKKSFTEGLKKILKK